MFRPSSWTPIEHSTLSDLDCATLFVGSCGHVLFYNEFLEKNMPQPIDLQFDKISMTSSGGSCGSEESRKSRKIPGLGTLGGGSKTQPTKDTIFARQFEKFKKDALVSGTFYNMFLFSLVAFIGVFIILVVFRPPLVMTTPKAMPDDLEPQPRISWPSILVWSCLMGLVVFAIAFFTRPKPSPAYVLEK